jgi:hypothetical protein
MMEKRFETTKHPHVNLTESMGDVTINGWKAAAVVIKGLSFEGQMETLDEVTIHSADAVELSVPASTMLTLGDLHGELVIKHIDGQITVQVGRGRITLSDMGSVEVQEAHEPIQGERVATDLTLHYVRGSAELGMVGGTVSVHTINGDLKLEQCDANVNLSNLGGRNELKQVGGEIRMVGGLASGEHQLVAEGNIIIRWPIDAPLSLVATASRILNQLPLSAETETLEDGLTILTGHIEEGKALLTVKTPGSIGLKAISGIGEDAFDLDDFSLDAGMFAEPSPPRQTASASHPKSLEASDDSETMPTSVETRLADEIVNRLDETEVGMSRESLRKIVAEAVAKSIEFLMAQATTESSSQALATDAQLRAKEVMREVERSLQKAKESMDASLKQVQRPAKSQTESRQESVSRSALGPADDERMVTEEQLQILRLLEEGHITAQQAQILLKSLAE